METFTVQHAERIVQQMTAWVAAGGSLTDFTVGSRTRTLLEAVAGELEELYYQLSRAISEGIPESCYQVFSFPKRAARKATGTCRFSRTTAAPAGGIAIAEGTTVATVGESGEQPKRFLATAAGTIAEGQTYADVTVAAEESGTTYNVQADTITALVDAVTGVDTVTNPLALTGGEDAESDESRAARFRAYIGSLAQGTASAVETAALAVEDVTGCQLVASPTVTCLVADAGTYTDISEEANLPGGTAAGLFPTSPANGDALYVGAAIRFDAVQLHLRQAGVNTGTIGAWEYYDGTAWTAIPNAQDMTNGFQASDAVTWTFADVSDWRRTAVNGTTAYWVRFRLVAAERITTAPTLSYLYAAPAPGTARVYAHDGNGALSATLRASVEQAVEQAKAGGVKAVVTAPVLATTDLSLALDVADGHDPTTVAAQVASAVRTYFGNLSVGQRVSREELSQLVMNANDEGIADVTWTAPTADLDVSPEQLLVLGTLTVA